MLAVGAGFFSTQILSLAGDKAYSSLAPAAFDAATHSKDTASLIVMLAYASIAGFIGAYIAARLAARRPVAHALVLGLVSLALTIVSTFLAWDAAPPWYHAATLLLVVPVAFLAGTVREMQTRSIAA